MPRLRLEAFDDDPDDGPALLLPDHLVAELHRLAGTVAGPAGGVDIELGIQPVMVFQAASEAGVRAAAGAWCRDHLGKVSTMIGSWMRFVEEDDSHQLGLVLEAEPALARRYSPSRPAPAKVAGFAAARSGFSSLAAPVG
ncbi:hypothetical protein ACLQ2P_07135 [Actinomadura citrea]|uniref:hypothetical protein n=1 Tax=Actinomadura citrea TaxID=46158 RepID=UPI003CE4BF94